MSNTQTPGPISDENIAFENLMEAFLAYMPFERGPDAIFGAILENLTDATIVAAFNLDVM